MSPLRTGIARLAALSYVMIVALCAAVLADVALSRRDADSLQRKVTAMQRFAASSRGRTLATPVSEAEVNSYIRYQLAGDLPAGVGDPYLRILGGGRVDGRAVVDLDRVRTSQRRGWLDPMNLVTGRLLVTAEGTLVASDGVARFSLASAAIAGVPIPKLVLAELVAYYTRSSDHPRGIGLDDPFPLPARIVGIDIEAGRAVVRQR